MRGTLTSVIPGRPCYWAQAGMSKSEAAGGRRVPCVQPKQVSRASARRPPAGVSGVARDAIPTTLPDPTIPTTPAAGLLKFKIYLAGGKPIPT